MGNKAISKRLERGFVHVDHHPKMIDPNVQAQTSLETPTRLRAQTSLDKTPVCADLHRALIIRVPTWGG